MQHTHTHATHTHFDLCVYNITPVTGAQIRGLSGDCDFAAGAADCADCDCAAAAAAAAGFVGGAENAAAGMGGTDECRRVRKSSVF